jgi:hypothetical protein
LEIAPLAAAKGIDIAYSRSYSLEIAKKRNKSKTECDARQGMREGLREALLTEQSPVANRGAEH